MSTQTTTRIPRGLGLVVLALIAFFLGRSTSSSGGSVVVDEHAGHTAPATEVAKKAEVWTCSMHPQVRLAEPGSCPYCGMDLILAAGGGGDEDEGVSELRMSEGAMRRAQIQTAKVERRDLAFEIPLVGRVVLDETRVTTFTSRVEGRLDRLFVDYIGIQVKTGDHLAEIYSPLLYSAQEELLRATLAAEKVSGSDLELFRESSLKTVKSAHARLHLLGIDEQQIEELFERGTPSVYMTMRSPVSGTVIHKAVEEGAFVKEGSEIMMIADLSKVWVVLDAYESDLAWLRYGQAVYFTVEAYPGERFEARVAFIDPVLDPKTLTVKVRLNVDNADGRLKPEMFVRAQVDALLSSAGNVVDASLESQWMCPMHPEVTSDGPSDCTECGMPLVPVEELGFAAAGDLELPLAVPDTAPMFTGRRSVVYVQLPDREMPSFEGREVLLGPHAGDYYVVLEGLMEGEDVVVNGNFKIDSELQIRAKRSMMSADVGGASSEPTSRPIASRPLVVPSEFRAGLGQLLESYLVLADGLASDALKEPAQRELAERFDALDMGQLKGRAHLAWMKAAEGLGESVDKFAGAKDVEAARLAFGTLSASLLAVVEDFGFEASDAPLAVFHCPMAFDMEGADWIAPDGATRNPYFGSDMLKCGDITGKLKGNSPESPAEAEMPGEMDMDMDMDMDEPNKEPAAPEVSTEFQVQLGELVDAYLQFEQGLTVDDDNLATRSILMDTYKEIDMGGLRGKAHMAWMKGAPGLKAAIEAAIASVEIEDARAALAPLSSQLIAVIERFGLPKEQDGRAPLAVFHCPMAFDFEGANWLGEAGPVKNPFFGTEMQTCGSVVRELGNGEVR